MSFATRQAGPFRPPRMLDDHERAGHQRRGTPDRRADLEWRGRRQDNDGREEISAAGVGGDACTACEAALAAGVVGFRGAAKSCHHAFCVTCVGSYFAHGETECPVCGIADEVASRVLTQPAVGQMLTTFENGFKLPDFETTSRGTIVVTYSFPAGIQTVSTSHDYTLQLLTGIYGLESRLQCRVLHHTLAQ